MNYSIKKIISKTVLAGIIISLLPMSIPAKAMKKPAKISRHTIDKKIAKLKKIIKKINQLKILVPTLILGAGIPITILLASAGVLGIVIGTIMTPLSGPIGTTAFSAMMFGLVTLGGGAIRGIGTSILAIGALGGLSAAGLLIAIANIQNLEKIEKRNPGTLSDEQLKIVAQFKNSIKGPILKGIIRGLKVRKANGVLARTAVNKNSKFFIKKFGNKKHATKVVKKYLMAKWKSNNLNNSLQKYNLKIDKQKTIRNKYSMWKKPVEYHFHNTKLIGLKLSPLFLTLKLKAGQQANYVEKLKRKYGFKNKLKNAVNAFIQQADAIAAEFKKPLKRRAK